MTEIAAVARKVIPPPWYKEVGGGGREVDGTPYLGFLICCNISKRFCLQEKAFDLLYKMTCFFRVLALLEVSEVTNTEHDHHLGCHLGFYQEVEIRLKKRAFSLKNGLTTYFL